MLWACFLWSDTIVLQPFSTCRLPKIFKGRRKSLHFRLKQFGNMLVLPSTVSSENLNTSLCVNNVDNGEICYDTKVGSWQYKYGEKAWGGIQKMYHKQCRLSCSSAVHAATTLLLSSLSAPAAIPSAWPASLDCYGLWALCTILCLVSFSVPRYFQEMFFHYVKTHLSESIRGTSVPEVFSKSSLGCEIILDPKMTVWNLAGKRTCRVELYRPGEGESKRKLLSETLQSPPVHFLSCQWESLSLYRRWVAASCSWAWQRFSVRTFLPMCVLYFLSRWQTEVRLICQHL